MAVIPIVSIIGRSGSGKTTLIEKLVRELSGKGYRIATVKHVHCDFQIDRAGKDSDRHRQAGASPVILAGARKVAVMLEVAEELPLKTLCERFIRDVDLVMAEGYRSERHPSILVIRREGDEEYLHQHEPQLIAVAAGCPVRTHVPVYSLDDVQGLTERILMMMFNPMPQLHSLKGGTDNGQDRDHSSRRT